MRTASKLILGAGVVALGALGLAAAAFLSVDVRELGRTDPRRAANYRLPWSNFSETYTNGQALGVTVGSTRAEADEAARRAGYGAETKMSSIAMHGIERDGSDHEQQCEEVLETPESTVDAILADTTRYGIKKPSSQRYGEKP